MEQTKKPEEILAFAKTIRWLGQAIITIPIHWGLYEGSAEDAGKFGELLKTKNVTVLSGK